MNSRFNRYFDAKDNWKLFQLAGVANDPVFVDLWERAQSPIGCHAEKARRKLANMLDRRLAHLDAIQSQPAPMPDVPPPQAITAGFQGFDPTNGVFHTPLNIDFNTLEEHLAGYGPTGIGKTSFFRFLLRQLVDKGVFVEFVDYKNGEGRSIPGAMVFRADQYPWNMLEPIGNSNIYYSAFVAEFANTFALRTETWPELVRFLLRIERGLKGDPYPSLKDFERLLFAVGQSDDNPKFLTAATAFASLNAILGKAAYIRKAPDISMRYPIIVHDYEGLPLRLCSFLNAVHLLRAQMKASVEGHA